MNILILVQATHLDPWDKIIEAQKRTWDSISVPGVDTIYYYSHPEKTFYEGKNLYVKCSGEHGMEHWRMKLALDQIFDTFANYDFIFRTNASSYVNKELLKEFLKDKPREKYYCGINGGGFASGCGFIMTYDLVQVIKENFSDYPTDSEDCYCGVIMQRSGIEVSPGAQRYDWWWNDRNKYPDVYHYRCKSNDENRDKDIEAFEILFKHFHG